MIRLAAAHRRISALLAGLVLSASLLASALPRTLEASFDGGAHDTLAQSPPTSTALGVTWDGKYGDSVAQVIEGDTRWRGMLPPAMRNVADPTRLMSFGTTLPITGKMHRYLALMWVFEVDERIRYVEGVPPGPRQGKSFEIALAASAAAEFDVETGDEIRLGELTAKVTGLFEPLGSATSGFWAHHAQLTGVERKRTVGSPEDDLILTGITDGDGLAAAEQRLFYRWTIMVDPAKVTARNAEDVLSGIPGFNRRLLDEGVGPFTSLDRILPRYLDRLAAARALVAVLLGGLAMVCLGAIALAVRLLADRMRSDLSLMRARGASLPHLAAAGGVVAAIAACPAALAGYAAGGLVPGPATPVVHLGPPMLALAAVAFAVTWVARAHRRPLEERRDDIVAARTDPRRITLEILVITLGVIGVQLLRTRGLGTGDPFLVLAPPLLALAAALVALRVYPLLLRPLLLLAARRRGAAPYLGLTMAARAASGAALPVLTLLPALAIGAYGAATADGLESAQRLAAWQTVGAEIQVKRVDGIPPDLVDRIRRAPGVHGVVPAAIGETTAEVGFGGRRATVVAIDLDAYGRLLEDGPVALPPGLAAPLPADPGDTGVSGDTGTAEDTGAAEGRDALVSPGLAAMPRFEIGWPERLTVVNRGAVSALPGVTTDGGDLIVIPAPHRQQINTLFVNGDAAAVKAAVRAAAATGTVITTVEEESDRIHGASLNSALVTALRVASLALAGYALIAAGIAFVSQGRERSRALRLLGTLGLTTGQARTVTVLEVAPLLLLTTCAGVVLGLGLPALLGPGVDLSAFTGPGGGPLQISPASALPPAAGVVLIALACAYLGGSRAKSV
ncbi:FtsX-like permease family protein [Sphaerimonospora mesophila]|uniref:FtsX-like permease family protein n=1 Tax=Sphaerimonospora mesophila TaxID=37483 RepID=UPI0006E25229